MAAVVVGTSPSVDALARVVATVSLNLRFENGRPTASALVHLYIICI